MANFQHVEVARVFGAAPDALWSIYTDHAGWKDWAGPAFRGAHLKTRGAPDPNGSGAVRCFGSGPLQVLEEIVDFEAPKRMTYRLISPGPLADHFGEVLFDPLPGPGAGQRTRITWRCRFRSRIPGLGPLLRIGVERLFRGVLGSLAGRFPAAD